MITRNSAGSLARSSTLKLPFLPSGEKSRSPSPKRGSTADISSGVESAVEEANSVPRQSAKVSKIASWFEGSSEPVNVGFVATPKDPSEPFYKAQDGTALGSQEGVDTVKKVRTKSVAMASANSSVFSFFGRKPTQTKTDPSELINLNVQDVLFPHGGLDDYSPASFKNLQQNAEGIIRSFQAAYAANLAELRKIASDLNIQQDELSTHRDKNECLKMQLLEMADRAHEQEKSLADLRLENEQLKANEAALRSIRVIQDNTDHHDGAQRRSTYRRTRSSDVSYTDSLDSASDAMSISPSIFSEDDTAHSPATSVGCPSPVLKQARIVSPSMHHQPRFEHPQPLNANVMVPECQNCYGMKSSEAWDVMNVMKAESAALKTRIAELELAQDGALDLLAGLDFAVLRHA